jgi:hypothetical protein
MFGSAFAFNGDVLAISAFSSQRVFIYSVNSETGMYEVEGELSSSSPDRFGASLAWYGDTLFVGAPMSRPNQDGTTLNFAGAIFAVTKQMNRWSDAEIDRSHFELAEAREYMGASLRISGSTMVAGAPGIPGNDEEVIGKARVFDISGTTLTEVAALRPETAVVDDYFGGAVDVEGDLIVVGAQGRSDARGGYAVVFQRSGDGFEAVQTLTPPVGSEPLFGGEVLIVDSSQLFIGGASSVVEFTGEPGSFVVGRTFAPCTESAGLTLDVSNDILVAGGDFELGYTGGGVFDLSDPDDSCVESVPQ